MLSYLYNLSRSDLVLDPKSLESWVNSLDQYESNYIRYKHHTVIN